MLFNSYLFIFLFLPLAIALFFASRALTTQRVALTALTVVSLCFYAAWNPLYLPLLLLSIGLNFIIGRQLSTNQSNANQSKRSTSAKALLSLGLIINLALIGYYKYADFLATSLLPPSLYQTLNSEFAIAEIALPLAISFFTFQQIGYLVDAYRGDAPAYGFGDYCLFVSFFPQLIAGPIVRHQDLIPQFHQPQTFKPYQRHIILGLAGFALGLSKKVLIADNLAPWVGEIFANAGDVGFLEAWVGAIAYSLQLYFDFSGYSDMAIGLALMFNIRLPINFNSPYKATSIVSFWRRWHITLSNFLRDYLYIPLGGSRKGEVRRYSNLLTTMLLGGLWHGAGWTFVLWGGLHGSYLCINHAWQRLSQSLNQALAQRGMVNVKMPSAITWTITMVAVTVSWVVFRAQTLSDGLSIIQAMSGVNGIAIPGSDSGKLAFLQQLGFQLTPWNKLAHLPKLFGNRLAAIGVLIALVVICVRLPNTQQIVNNLRPNTFWAIGFGLLSVLCLLSLNQVSEFLYFQF